ncbi:hypothetical protein EPIR_3296 [Erwinia piriflorinigrans CFBP 5888]|uniref:Uncharacterized protein n=1 Tax=Erwinia piriflorinigrans CFBP 5888 TaxID=1161919 RepID=V5ZCI3_9GAMM|nr:hypothetical protein EPIR_3296 [Erwinia piriflorinigrans CFBP 5888]
MIQLQAFAPGQNMMVLGPTQRDKMLPQATQDPPADTCKNRQ